MVTTAVGVYPCGLIALIMSGMQGVQVGARTGKTLGSLGRFSVFLFALGSFDAGIYLAELITDGVRWVQMLESAFVLLFVSWIAGAVHLLRIRKAERQNR